MSDNHFCFIVLWKDGSTMIFGTKPERINFKGDDLRLFRADDNVTILDLVDWIANEYQNPKNVSEVNWQ